MLSVYLLKGSYQYHPPFPQKPKEKIGHYVWTDILPPKHALQV